MATIKERAAANGEKRYDVRVRVKGHAVQCRTFLTKTSAHKWARNMESAIDEGRVSATSPGAKRVNFTKVLDRYKVEILPNKRASTQKTQRAQIEFWREHFHNLA